MRYVQWTLDEKAKVREEYQRLRSTTDYSQEACLTTAMVILPEHRRKAAKNCSSKVLRQIGIGAEKPRNGVSASKKRSARVAKPPVEQTMIDTKQVRDERVPGAIGIATERFVGEIAMEVAGAIGLQVMDSVRRNVDCALYGMFDRLVTHVTEAVLKEVGEVVRNSMSAPIEPPAQNITFQTAPVDSSVTGLTVAPRNRKPKVVVLGLMSQQQQEIRREFSEVCDLSFLQSQTLAAQQLAGKDMAFIMIKFSRHSAELACQSQHVPFYRVTGGVSHLRIEMRKWINGEVAIAEVANG